MKAMILAGGLSTRLYPLTRQVPKPLVPIAGEPNAGHLMRYLRSHGISDVAINVFYLAEQITAALGDGAKYGVELSYLHERELSGSAGAVKQLEAHFNGTFVVVGCDAVTNVDLGTLIRFHKERKALATMALCAFDDVEQFGVVEIDSQGRVFGFQEKPKAGEERSNLVNTGIYVFEPEIFRHIPADCFYDFGHNVFPALLAAKEALFGLEMRAAYWADIGTIAEYRRANEEILEGRFLPTGARRMGIARSALVARDLRISGSVRIGENVRIAEGVSITGPTIVGDNVVIDANATIDRSILFDGVRIAAQARVKHSIIGLGYDIAVAAEVEDEVLAHSTFPLGVS